MNERIQKIRKNVGLTQAEFAGKIGFQKSTVAGWEKNNPVPLNAIISICLTFKVRREWLENGAGDMFEANNDSEQTASAFARSFGCDDFTAKIFERYCAFSDDEKQRFSKLLKRLLEEPEVEEAQQENSICFRIRNVRGKNVIRKFLKKQKKNKKKNLAFYKKGAYNNWRCRKATDLFLFFVNAKKSLLLWLLGVCSPKEFFLCALPSKK